MCFSYYQNNILGSACPYDPAATARSILNGTYRATLRDTARHACRRRAGSENSKTLGSAANVL